MSRCYSGRNKRNGKGLEEERPRNAQATMGGLHGGELEMWLGPDCAKKEKRWNE